MLLEGLMDTSIDIIWLFNTYQMSGIEHLDLYVRALQDERGDARP
jgi:hypothetical protein